MTNVNNKNEKEWIAFISLILSNHEYVNDCHDIYLIPIEIYNQNYLPIDVNSACSFSFRFSLVRGYPNAMNKQFTFSFQ